MVARRWEIGWTKVTVCQSATVRGAGHSDCFSARTSRVGDEALRVADERLEAEVADDDTDRLEADHREKSGVGVEEHREDDGAVVREEDDAELKHEHAAEDVALVDVRRGCEWCGAVEMDVDHLRAVKDEHALDGVREEEQADLRILRVKLEAPDGHLEVVEELLLVVPVEEAPLRWRASRSARQRGSAAAWRRADAGRSA